METRDTESKSANDVQWTAEKIWGNFLNCGTEETWFDVENNEDAPEPEKQRRNIKKFEDRKALKILSEDAEKNHFEIKVFKDKFQDIRQQFRNTRTAFNAYRLEQISPINIPKNTKWEHIIIKFLNGHDILIKLRNDKEFIHKTNYEKMGFQDNRKLNPNAQWEFLKNLAEINGSISWNNSVANDNLKKSKQLLAKTLQACFQIDEDPFHSYRKEKAYTIKLTLIP